MEFVVLGYRNLIAQPVDVNSLDNGNFLSDFFDDIGLKDFVESIDMAPFQEAGTNIRLHLNATGIGRGNIYQRIELGSGQVAFKLLPWHPTNERGVYLEAHRGDDSFPQGAVLARAAHRLGSEHIFNEIQLDDTHVALETPFGTFVTAENNGKVAELVTDRNVIGEWQQFMYLVPPQGLLPRIKTPAEKVQEQLEDVLDDPGKAKMRVGAGESIAEKFDDLTNGPVQSEMHTAEAIEGPFETATEQDRPPRSKPFPIDPNR